MDADYLVLPCPLCAASGQVNAANVNQSFPDAVAQHEAETVDPDPDDDDDPPPATPEPEATDCPNCRGVGAYLSTTREGQVLPSMGEFIDFDALESGLLASGAVLEEVG